jgi:hypothetical protein
MSGGDLRRKRSESQLSAWESNSSALYFHNLQNRLGKINVHATHTVHAVPDLRLAGGRLGDGFYHALLFATADLRLLFCARSKPISASSLFMRLLDEICQAVTILRGVLT